MNTDELLNILRIKVLNGANERAILDMIERIRDSL